MRTQTRPRGSLGGRHLRKNRNFRGLRPAERRLFFFIRVELFLIGPTFSLCGIFVPGWCCFVIG